MSDLIERLRGDCATVCEAWNLSDTRSLVLESADVIESQAKRIAELGMYPLATSKGQKS